MGTKDDQSSAQVSERLARVRREVFGPRGRAAFARALGISPSTYNYYEKGRRPPADLLARAAEVTGADLEWLITGRGEPFPQTPTAPSATHLSQPAQEILERFAQAAGAGPKAVAANAALAALLQEIQRAFPALAQPQWRPHVLRVKPTCVPILGRTAAGLLAGWEEFFAGHPDPEVLSRMIRAVEGQAGRERAAGLRATDREHEAEQPADTSATLIQLSAPTPDGVAEFVDVPRLEGLGPGAFALRVDGDSMAPRILDGDIIISRRDAPPAAGRTAVVKVRGRVGVTVKLWRPEGDCVHLIPINEAYEPARCRRTDILWACRVLGVARV